VNKFVKVVFKHTPEVEKADTSLRYTDILFGFVIKELFVRLQDWALLDCAVRLHLIVGTTLVLGSWIGFRRSLNRPRYQVKFFNLPFSRFILDQLMLILYFRVAVLTPSPIAGKTLPDVNALARTTVKLVAAVYVLYLFWDLLGIWMDKSRIAAPAGALPRYPEVDNDNQMTNHAKAVDWIGFLITLGVQHLLQVRGWQATALLRTNCSSSRSCYCLRIVGPRR
jgi:hypothetical protein